MATHDNKTSRRSVLGALAVIPAVIASPAIAQQTASVDTAAWDAALARFNEAAAEDDAFNVIHSQISEAYEEARPSIDMIDFHAFPGMDRNHVAHICDVELRYRRYMEGEGKTWWARDPEAQKARARRSVDSVLEYRRQLAEAERATGMDAAEERWNALGDRRCDADTALMNTPAPHHHALLLKLERLLEIEGDGCSAAWSASYIGTTMADARRLLSGEA